MTKQVIESAGKVCLSWWGGMQRYFGSGESNRAADPGALAELRRASTVVRAASVPQTLALYGKLAEALGWETKFDERRLVAVAVIAHVTSHVRTGDGKLTVAHRLGAVSMDDASMKQLRFRRLMAAERPEDIMREFRGAVELLDRAAPVTDLSVSLLAWMGVFGPGVRDSTRLRWIYDYHRQGDAAPELDSLVAQDAV